MEQESIVMKKLHYPIAPEYVFDNLDSLRQLRRTMKWGIKHVARLAKMNEESYNQIEQGYIFPSRERYNELAKVFDLEEWE